MPSRIFSPWTYALLALAGLPFGQAQSLIPASERQALIALYESTKGDQWNNNDNWLGPPGSEASWFGVTVSDGHVSAIHLSHNNLTGHLPSQLGDLAQLRALVADSALSPHAFDNFGPYTNNLSGTLPPELGNLSLLEELSLPQGLFFDSTFPLWITNLTNLRRLDLSFAISSPQIPSQIGQLTSLQELRLSFIGLQQLPAEFANLQSLKVLDLSANFKLGLPSPLLDLVNLEDLDLSATGLDELDPSISQLTNLKRLALGSNELAALPASLAELNLKELRLSFNPLGSLPSPVDQISGLESLELASCQIGQLDPSIGNLSSLKRLVLNGNDLEQLPAEFNLLDELEEVELFGNSLQQIPAAFLSAATGLRVLKAGRNPLSQLQPEILQLDQLEVLALQEAGLEGEIPAQLAGLSRLRELDLGSNQLSGALPAWLSQLTMLQSLGLAANQLSGPIPESLGSLAELRVLNLASNQLEGEIPASLGQLSKLETLSLSRNRLSGAVPAELGQLAKLMFVRLRSNRLSGELPAFDLSRLLILEISYNAFNIEADGVFCHDGTQTSTPGGLRADPVLGSSETRLRWTPILYDAPGGYRILSGPSPQGPFHLAASIESKQASQLVLADLDPDQDLYFAIQSFSHPHEINPSEVSSDISTAVAAPALAGPSPAPLFLPIYLAGNGQQSGIAFSNPSLEGAEVTLTLRGMDGQPLPVPSNPVIVNVGAGAQTAMLGREFFEDSPLADRLAWVEMVSDNPHLASLFLYGSLSRLDGSIPALGQSRRLFFPLALQGPLAPFAQTMEDGTTYLGLANPNQLEIEVHIRLVRTLQPFSQLDRPQPRGGPIREKTLSIPAKGSFYESLLEIFPALRSDEGYIEVEVVCGPGAVGFELVDFSRADSIVILPGVTGNEFSRSFSAQLASGPDTFTKLRLSNVSDGSRKAVLELFGDDGSLLGSREAELDSRTTLEGEAREVFGLPTDALTTGSLLVTADGDGLIGSVLFGKRGTLSFAAGMPLQNLTFQEAVFSQVASTSQIFTGLALFNPGAESATASIQVFTPGGMLIGEAMVELGAWQRRARLLSEWVPLGAEQLGGFIIVRSDRPLAGQQLFGDRGGAFLSTVPATILR